jgi:hypothetical protein
MPNEYLSFSEVGNSELKDLNVLANLEQQFNILSDRPTRIQGTIGIVDWNGTGILLCVDFIVFHKRSIYATTRAP